MLHLEGWIEGRNYNGTVYDSHSEADYGYWSILSHYTKDEKVILEAFKKSRLHDRGKKDSYILYGIRKLLERKESEGKSDKKQNESTIRRGLSVAELFEITKNPLEWLVDGFLTADGFSALVAKPKVGKSTLSRNLAYCIATGKEFLGRSVKRGKVLCYFLEESIYDIRDSIESMGYTTDTNVKFYTLELFKGIEDRVKIIEEDILNENPVLVIIDTLFKAVGINDENRYAEALKKIEPVLLIAREHKVHVMATLHASKNSNEKDAVDAILGSTAIAGSFDTIFLIKKRPDFSRTIQTEQRKGKNLMETYLEFTENTKLVEIGETITAKVKKNYESDIRKVLLEAREPMSEDRILKLIKGNQNDKLRAVHDLYLSGEIIRTGDGKRGSPYVYNHRDNIDSELAVLENMLRGTTIHV